MEKHPEIQFLPKAEIKKYQERRLREALEYLSSHSPFYKKMFAAHEINPFTIQTLEDLRNVPVTTKKDLQLYGPDFMCVTGQSHRLCHHVRHIGRSRDLYGN